MAQQGKQMRVGARLGFSYRSVKLVSLAKGVRYEVDSNTFLEVVNAFYPLKYCPGPSGPTLTCF
jgi:hypothetical protein